MSALDNPPDRIVHGEPWWTSKVEPEHHRWSVRCVRDSASWDGSGWAVNVLDMPSIVRDHHALANALASASAWIVTETVRSGEAKLRASRIAGGASDG